MIMRILMFEKDIHLPWLDKDGWGEVESLLKESDVFHFHMTDDEYTILKHSPRQLIFHGSLQCLRNEKTSLVYWSTNLTE